MEGFQNGTAVTQTGQNIYKMRTVASLTGFSPTLLRAWERRFDFLSPSRLPGGHRVYTESDLTVLQRVKELLDSGQAIGAVASLGREALLSSAPSEESKSLAEGALGLAPCDLQTFRSTRYGGEGLGVSMVDLELDDLATITRLYKLLTGVYGLWLYLDQPECNEKLILARLSELVSPEFQVELSKLGSGSSNYSELMKAALEDTKRGALLPLIHHYREASEGRSSVKVCVLLARDQAKIMRNAFLDIDHNLRPADESPKAHGVAGMVKKVADILPHYEAVLDWDGSVSSRCLETSAVDRVLYDFVRRIEATNPASTTLWVGAINDTLTRWVFRFGSGLLRPHQAKDLAAIAVGSSVGVTPSASLELGYLGCTDDGWAWFHWPIFEVPKGAHICDCDL